MTEDEFEQGYAERSGLTLAELHELGLFGIPCLCGDETCEGWQMSSANREPGPWEPEAQSAWRMKVRA